VRINLPHLIPYYVTGRQAGRQAVSTNAQAVIRQPSSAAADVKVFPVPIFDATSFNLLRFGHDLNSSL
jgi:hypothetical protein